MPTMRFYTFILVALLFIFFYFAVDAVPSNSTESVSTESEPQGGKTSPSIRNGVAIGVGCSAIGGTIIVGALVYRYRRKQKQQEATKASNATSRTGAGRGGMRGSIRPSRSSSIMLRHAVQNNSNHQSNQSTLGGPIPSMKRGGRRKGAPTAIMVEVPPASVSLGLPVTTPSNTGAGQRVTAQRSIGLHVPPSPAYDFRGRGNEMPVTPRTPCMTMPTSGNSVADRMV